MRVHIEYGKQTLNCEMSDTPKSMRIALVSAWGMTDEDSDICFIPRPKPISKKLDKKTLSELKNEWRHIQ